MNLEFFEVVLIIQTFTLKISTEGGGGLSPLLLTASKAVPPGLPLFYPSGWKIWSLYF